MNGLLRFALLSLVLALAACGFHLREARPLSAKLARVQIEAVDPFSTLPLALTRALRERGAEVGAGEGATVLKITRDEATTEPLTIGDAARVQEYRVLLRLSFELRDADGNLLLDSTTIERQRDYRFDETQALGASSEDERVREELRREQIYALLRALEAVP